MISSSQHLLFFFLLMTGVLTTLSSTSWFMAWIGLELNLMSFIPLISTKMNQFSSEASLKYFLVQALGSALIILAAPLTMIYNNSLLILLVALLLKLGAAPFHFWFPPIMEGLSWIQCIILMTIQKIAPLFLISHLILHPQISNLIIFAALLSSIFGALGGLNQTSLRKILAFSSINHLSWMLMAITMGDYVWVSYFSFYSVISTSIALYFYSKQFYYFPHLFSKGASHNFSGLITSLGLLSLGGLPPFSGFLPKWIMMEMLTAKSLFIPVLVLILSTLVTLYYYLRVSMTFLILETTNRKLLAYSPSYSGPFYTPMILALNFFLLFTPSLFFLF
uniref:NADH-ubiquinone oxidoreductase chain 2 n=1 Tax=Thenus orientalis TaxID=57071 RepID=A0A068W6Z7_THEOI|nr:NADH dehydrogenase subunit 2 [Thenus orientalis]CDR98460.1 NADH dehydrogenase subunit 2 [Thenus orientalis]